MTTVVFDFQLDAEALEGTQQQYRPDSSHRGDLLIWWFVQAIELSCNGTNMLGWGRVARPRMPLLDVSLQVGAAINQAHRGASFVWSTPGLLPEPLLWEPASGDVRLTNPQTAVSERVPMSDLTVAHRAFEERARAVMLGVLPQLITDPSWGWWFRAEPDPRI